MSERLNMPKYTFRSLRIHPDIFTEIEALATQEHISVNALCNAIFALTVDLAQTEEGRAQIHAACTEWRTRWEHTMPPERRARLIGEEEER